MKKKFRPAKMIACSMLTGILLLQLTNYDLPVYATNIDDAKEQKEQAEENKKNAEQILSEFQNSRSEIATAVRELDAQMDDLQAKVTDLNNQKSELEANIAQKQADLEVAKQMEADQYASMCERIRFMYENDCNSDESYTAALLSSDTMCEILNQSEYVTALADYDYRSLENLVETRQNIANDEQMLEVDLQGVETLTAETQSQMEQLNAIEEEKKARMAEYDDLIARQEAVIAACDAEVNAAAARIAQLEAAAASSGNFVPYSGGGLVWPCPSSTRITSYFGYRTPDGGYVNANHKGVDIGAPTGTPVVAAASGVVVIARYSNSAGNWIVISHGNGFYTMYMHSSQLLVSEGQQVNAGDTIMLVGSTGWSTGPHLHFGVGVGGYLSANAVDPLSYFQ